MQSSSKFRLLILPLFKQNDERKRETKVEHNEATIPNSVKEFDVVRVFLPTSYQNNPKGARSIWIPKPKEERISVEEQSFGESNRQGNESQFEKQNGLLVEFSIKQ